LTWRQLQLCLVMTVHSAHSARSTMPTVGIVDRTMVGTVDQIYYYHINACLLLIMAAWLTVVLLKRYGDALTIQQKNIFDKNTHAIGLKHFVQHCKKHNIMC
jgi:hypothetical protein